MKTKIKRTEVEDDNVQRSTSVLGNAVCHQTSQHRDHQLRRSCLVRTIKCRSNALLFSTITFSRPLDKALLRGSTCCFLVFNNRSFLFTLQGCRSASTCRDTLVQLLFLLSSFYVPVQRCGLIKTNAAPKSNTPSGFKSSHAILLRTPKSRLLFSCFVSARVTHIRCGVSG
jgi:hypothetical protein